MAETGDKYKSWYSEHPEADPSPEYSGKPVNFEAGPEFEKTFLRPDGSTTKFKFFKNQFGNFYIVSEETSKTGQRLTDQRIAGDVEDNPEAMHLFLEQFTRGLGYKEQ